MYPCSMTSSLAEFLFMSNKCSLKKIWKIQRHIKRRLSFHPEMNSYIAIFPSAFLVTNKCSLFYMVIIDHPDNFMSSFFHVQL